MRSVKVFKQPKPKRRYAEIGVVEFEALDFRFMIIFVSDADNVRALNKYR
jgi:hypothetical protein